MTAKHQPHFTVDKEGLARVVSRRPKAFLVYELLQNAWDEPGVTAVQVAMAYQRGQTHISVTDDAPDGFRDLSHAYTLYAESAKKGNDAQRGRFNVGEKLVIALCTEAVVCSTKGSVVFDRYGRTQSRRHTASGTIFSGRVPMSREEYDAMEKAATMVASPFGVATTVNGYRLLHRETVGTVSLNLMTERADAEGYLRRSRRVTTVKLYEPYPGEAPSLFELGIPVVETGDRWHYDVQQKVPLNQDRDNVSLGYLHEIRAEVANRMIDRVTETEAARSWVGDALSSDAIEQRAAQAIIQKRYGDKAVIYDPSDQEANRIAVSKGYTVVSGGSLSRDQWDQVKRHAVLQPAGRVTPSPKPFSPDGRPMNLVPESQWTADMQETITLLSGLAQMLLGRQVRVQVANEITWPYGATFGPESPLILNLGRLGYGWFASPGCESQLQLLLHELGHYDGSSHLEEEWGENVARLGAKLARLVSKGDVLPCP